MLKIIGKEWTESILGAYLVYLASQVSNIFTFVLASRRKICFVPFGVELERFVAGLGLAATELGFSQHFTDLAQYVNCNVLGNAAPVLVEHWVHLASDEFLYDELTALEINHKLLVENLENVVAFPAHVLDVVCVAAAVFLRVAYVPQTGIYRADLRLRLLEDSDLEASVEVLCLFEIAEVEVAEAHLFVHLSFRSLVLCAECVLETKLPGLDGFLVLCEPHAADAGYFEHF